MKKPQLPRWIAISLLLFLLLIASLCVICQSSFFWETMIRKFGKETMAVLGIENITIARARVVWHIPTGRFMILWKDVDVFFKDHSQPSGHIGVISAEPLRRQTNSYKQGWACKVRNASWQKSQINIFDSHLDMELSFLQMWTLTGQLRMQKAQISNWTVEDLQSQIFCQPQVFNIENLSALVKTAVDQPGYEVKWDRVQIIKQQAGGEVILSGGQVDNSNLKLDRLDLSLFIRDFRQSSLSADGQITLGLLEWEGYQCHHSKSRVNMNGPIFTFNDLISDVFGGQIFGEISLDYSSQLSYSVAVTFKGWDTAQVERINKSVFSQVKGLYDGRLQMKGQRQGMTEFSGKITGISKMQIKAALMESLMSYVPVLQTITFQSKWEEFIASDAFVPVELLEMDWQSEGEEKINGALRLLSREMNQDLDVTFDINHEGRLRGPGYYLKKIKRFQ